jgi:hypothetical protein
VAEIVYVLTNPAMPGLVKIGFATDLVVRLKQLDTTGLPLPFECFYAAEVTDCRRVERALHEAFDDHRVRKSREFFRLSPEKPRAIIRLLATKEITPGADIVESADDQRALDEERGRRSGFRFDIVGIKPGETLVSVFDETVTATVLDNRSILFRGEPASLSGSAKKLAHENGYIWAAVQGPQYWKYDGTTLSELRNKIEFEDREPEGVDQ